MLPKDVVSSQFQYHLKSLQNQGLLQKESRGQYSLTHAGLAAIEYMSVGRDKPALMPKVITYTLLTHNGQLLLMHKHKEPYRGLLEPIGGKIHFGEEAADAAVREVHEKCGLHITKPTFCGTADMSIYKDGEPITHMTVYAHKAELGALPNPLPAHLVSIDAESLPAQNETAFVPGCLQLVTAMIKNTDKPFVLTIRADA